ncbi:MAG: hypothetical protein KAS32_14215 [Candidatus Peribacteraceae bacterium]|nr:hypothetical protein [Candidatus Peribacteraceae bacterium]
MKVGDIIFTRDDSWLSKLIRLRTLGNWSHVGIVMSINPFICIAAEFSGVKSTTIERWADCSQILRVKETKKQTSKRLQFIESQLGKPYDFMGFIDFLTMQNHQSNNRWFCSELVSHSFLEVGIDLFEGRRKLVAPSNLYENLNLEMIGELNKLLNKEAKTCQ